MLLAFHHSHHPPQYTTTPWHPKTEADIFCVNLCFYCRHIFCIWAIKYRTGFVILSKLSFGSWHVVQVRFAASGSTGRMFPLRQWSWTSPLVKGLSGLRTSWTASCRRSIHSPSKHMTVERVPMAPTWKSHTSESGSASSLHDHIPNWDK